MVHSALFATTSWLDAPDLDDYGLRPIPDDADRRIRALLREYVAPYPARARKSALLPNERRASILKAFAERMATQAVRKGNEEDVFIGLAALALCLDLLDQRELQVVLALLHDAALRIECEPASLVARLGPHFPTALRDFFTPFLTRHDDDRAIDAMGFVAVTRDDGITYMPFGKPHLIVSPKPDDAYYGPTTAAREAVNALLSLPATGIEQDWEIELGDPARLEDFLQVLASNPPDLDIRCALGLLTLATIDDAMDLPSPPRLEQLNRVHELIASDETVWRRLRFYFIGQRQGLHPNLLAFLLEPVAPFAPQPDGQTS